MIWTFFQVNLLYREKNINTVMFKLPMVREYLEYPKVRFLVYLLNTHFKQ